MTHIPVLLNETINVLNPEPGEFFIDGTFGSGGHSSEILKRVLPDGKLLGVDWDERNIELGKSIIKGQLTRVIFEQGNYADLPEILKKYNLSKANGLLLDLGFSSEQIENLGKGFSFLKDEPLIMRYDNKNEMTAAEVVNSFSEKDLSDIFYKYGEERFSRSIAKKIVGERKKEKILTTSRLVEIIKQAVPKSYEKGRIHPATRTFQALRIFVNAELENLEKLLKNLGKIIKTGGRVAIISFHSLEDRIVKNYFREMDKNGTGNLLTKKPIIASEKEIALNPRSRSAKLRAIRIK